MKKILVTTAMVLLFSTNMVIANDIPAIGGTKTEKDANYQQHSMKKDTLIAKLPKEKQEIFNKTMQKNRDDNKANYEKLHSLHKEKNDLMLAPEFDKNAYTAKTAEALAIENAINTSRNEAIALIAVQFTADERKILAKAASGRNYMGMKHKEGAGEKNIETKK